MVEKAETVNVRMTPKEKKMLEVLGDYLKDEGKIERNNRSSTVRWFIHAFTDMLLSEFEKRRYGGKT